MLPSFSDRHLVKFLASTSHATAPDCCWVAAGAYWVVWTCSCCAGALEPPNMDVIPAPKVWPMVEPTATPAAVDAMLANKPGPCDCWTGAWWVCCGACCGARAGTAAVCALLVPLGAERETVGREEPLDLAILAISYLTIRINSNLLVFGKEIEFGGKFLYFK